MFVFRMCYNDLYLQFWPSFEIIYPACILCAAVSCIYSFCLPVFVSFSFKKMRKTCSKTDQSLNLSKHNYDFQLCCTSTNATTKQHKLKPILKSSPIAKSINEWKNKVCHTVAVGISLA